MLSTELLCTGTRKLIANAVETELVGYLQQFAASMMRKAPANCSQWIFAGT